MAKKQSKRVSINQLDNFVKGLGDDICISWEAEYNGNELAFDIKKYISLQEVAEFVESVVTNCFDENIQTGETTYIPYYKDLMISKNTFEKFTNLSVPSNTSKFYQWTQAWNAKCDIEEQINSVSFQLSEIKKYIDEAIEFKKQEILSKKKSPVDELVKSINKIIESIGDNFNFEILADVLPVFQKLSENGKIDEKKLMDAWLNNDLKKTESEQNTALDNRTNIVKLD